MKVTDRLNELVAQLPKDLRADWDATNHYELTSSDPDTDYWWLVTACVFNEPSSGNISSSTYGRRLGLLLDIAEELVKCRDAVL